MKGHIFLGGMALLFTAALAGAQTKVSGTLNCPKPEPVYQIEVGDRPGHALALEKFACTWATPLDMGGDKTKDASVVLTAEITPARSAASGTSVTAMESGDKTFATFHDTTMIKDGKPEPAHGTWSYTGGTGQFKGIKGKGTFTRTLNADGTSTTEVEGEYELAKAAPAKGK